MAGGHSEVRLLLCDGCNGPIALEFGVTVINHHRPWACPKLAPHFQIGTGDCQLLEFLVGGEEEKSCQRVAARVLGPASASPTLTVKTRAESQGAWGHRAEVQAPALPLRALSWTMN